MTAIRRRRRELAIRRTSGSKGRPGGPHAGPDADEQSGRRLRGGSALRRPRRGRSALAHLSAGPRLFTATIAYEDGSVLLQAFHASVATHPMQVVQRLRMRFGDDVLPVAELRLGFHPGTPLVVALVPAAVADMIRQAERDCSRPAARSFAVDIEHRVEI